MRQSMNSAVRTEREADQSLDVVNGHNTRLLEYAYAKFHYASSKFLLLELREMIEPMNQRQKPASNVDDAYAKNLQPGKRAPSTQQNVKVFKLKPLRHRGQPCDWCAILAFLANVNSLNAVTRPPVRPSSVCNARAPYSAG